MRKSLTTPVVLATLVAALVSAREARADSIWDRRDPHTAYLFVDNHARNVGDLLTLIVSESTEFEGLEKRELNKATTAGGTFKLTGKAGSDNTSRSVNADLDTASSTQRSLDGKNNSTIDRRFIDRMTVTVVAVLPNGNMVIEGRRRQIFNHEERVLRVTGVVRPSDITALNTIQSQYIANFEVGYFGHGPESSYINHGWLGHILNVVWP